MGRQGRGRFRGGLWSHLKDQPGPTWGPFGRGAGPFRFHWSSEWKDSGFPFTRPGDLGLGGPSAPRSLRAADWPAAPCSRSCLHHPPPGVDPSSRRDAHAPPQAQPGAVTRSTVHMGKLRPGGGLVLSLVPRPLCVLRSPLAGRDPTGGWVGRAGVRLGPGWAAGLCPAPPAGGVPPCSTGGVCTGGGDGAYSREKGKSPRDTPRRETSVPGSAAPPRDSEGRGRGAELERKQRSLFVAGCAGCSAAV